MQHLYAKTRVTRKETKDHPIFAGPMLLLKDVSYQAYRAFFSHLCAELEHSVDNIELRLHESIEFGSDDEKAITKAIENSFPNAKRRLCTKHLKDNVKHYLQNHVSVNTTERNNIMSDIFGDDGLVSADNTFNFEAKSLQVKEVAENYTQFVEYYDRHLKPRISSFVT